ncbi:MAG: site-2 protease family protein [Candidatus Jorgensenbacteria bacterium]
MIVVAVIISLSVLILVHEFGHFAAAKIFGVKVEEFGLGFPPRLFGRKFGETLYSLNLLPFGGFVKIFGEDSDEPEPDSFSAEPAWRRSVIVLAGVLMNVVLGWLVFSAVFFAGAPNHLFIAQVSVDSPAYAADIKEGDVILEARSGETVLADPVPSGEFIGLVNANPAEALELKIMRGKSVFNVSLEGREIPPEGQGPLGISLVDVGFAGESLGKSFIKGFETTVSTLKLVAVGFVDFFLKLVVEPEVLKTVAGPVGIVALASQAGSLGFVYLLELMAFISVNLAVLNLIPFPALDGGRFLLLIIEKIRMKPISRRVQTAINAFGFILLLVLMVLITVQDISRLID